MSDPSSAAPLSVHLRPAMLQLVDHRGNVVVVDGEARYAGSVGRLPAFYVEGDAVEIVLIVGFEPVQLHAVVVEGCDARPGAIAVVSLVEWVAGGRRFRPDDGARAADRADGRTEERAGLSGRLEQLSLVDVVQLLASGQRSGVVEVVAETALGTPLPSGSVGLSRGQVVYARHGGDVGEEAFFALLGAARGRFAVRFDKAPPARNVERETTFLLLEHLRRLDEAARVPQAAVPRLESVPDGAVPAPLPVRPAMSPTVLIPSAPVVEPKAKKKRPSLPPQPEERDAATPRTGRFARFFDEVASERPLLVDPPPPVVDDLPLPSTERVRFSSLAVTMSNTGGPFERDTDIVDRALISA